MSRSILSVLVAALVAGLASLALDGCCGAGCPPRTTNTAPSSSAHAALAPRMDLHCTPQSIDDESKCLALGDDRNYGPPLSCRGTPPPPDLVAAEHEAWEKGTSPCVCTTDYEEQMCRSVP